MTSNPFTLFDSWFTMARESEPNDSNAMTIATVNDDGQPSARMVLLKGHGPDGFIFYTNKESRKAEDIAANPKAAILFHWKSLRRQIRIEGSLSAVADDIADAYFATRGRDSQLGAWASDQSRPLDSRATFEQRYKEMQMRFDGQDVPRPPYWSGYRLTPQRFEFWQDREHRLHERRIFVRDGEGWAEGMLYP
ncbi:pyridoxamine 5'-phosphate oxidase [Parasphingorhabdus sp. JC815]|uniref:pyridoxamine 5'-phosphate oxidase n=1 Tax=Parasphingorhabdus sp. JC815 TaxID=3232140 RepID=UPI00345A0D51